MDIEDFICDFNGFVSVFDSRDFILIVNIFMFGLTVWWIRRQVQVTDVKVYFQIMQRLTDVYEQYNDAENQDQNVKIVEIFNLLESLARLHYKRRIHGVTRDMVKEYLLEIVPKIGQEGPVREAFLQNRSGPDTYGYIRRFAKSHGIKGIPHS